MSHLTTAWCSRVSSRGSFVLIDFADTAEVYRRSEAEGFKMDSALLVFKSKLWERETDAKQGKEGCQEDRGRADNINEKCVVKTIHGDRKRQ